jgi:hypothetical protein
LHRQPSIEDVEDEDTVRPRNAVPKKASHIIELADGSEDDDDDDIPGLAPVDDSDDEDESEEDEEAPAESAEAELSTHPTKICRKFKANNKI